MVGARQMLLHDEHPGADAAHRELLVTLDRHLVKLDPGDPREWRTLA